MICVSVTPTSRTLAPADVLNASRKCDLVEICLDRFIKTPDVGELLKLSDRPVIFSCRRQKDGGQWSGSEEDRLKLLRSAIIAGPQYVELELDIAGKIPRFGDTKRVISYTSLNSVPTNIDDIFEQCWQAKADVVKVTWPTDDLDAVWPLLAAVTGKRELPVVGQGIGKSSLTFSLLGRRYGSPWIYAALERGMETYASQPTIWQLEEYCWEDLERKTRFVGVVGLGAAENVTVRVLNAAFRELGKRIRCLPILPGRSDRLTKMLDTLKINALLVDPMYSGNIDAIGSAADPVAEATGFCDVLLRKESGWRGRCTLFDAVNAVVCRMKNDRWAEGRPTTVFGTGRLAIAAAQYLNRRNAAVSLAGPHDNAAAQAAGKASARHISWSAIHASATDVIVLADSNIASGTARTQLNPSLIREGMTVIDLTAYPADSEFAEEAVSRGATYVTPADIFAEQIQTQFRMLTSLPLPRSAFVQGLGG